MLCYASHVASASFVNRIRSCFIPYTGFERMINGEGKLRGDYMRTAVVLMLFRSPVIFYTNTLERMHDGHAWERPPPYSVLPYCA